jgi:hypothetical protein
VPGQLRRENVWIKDGQYVRSVPVMAGLSDGANTEIHSDALKDGTEVVVGEVITMGPAGSTQTNPFAPPPMRGNRGGQGGQRGGAGGGGGGGGARGGGGR